MKTGSARVALILGVVLCQSVVRVESNSENATDACGKPTVWNDFNVVELKMTSLLQPGGASWRMILDNESADIQVDIEFNDGAKTERGRILLVGGRVMATQGAIIQPGAEIDSLDVPVMEWQLVARLLGRSLPEGPPAAQTIRQIDFTDEKTGIQFATPSAQGFVPAPWHVRGEVTTVDRDVVEFELALTVDAKATPGGRAGAYDETFTGRLSKVASGKIDDTLSLDGWSLFGLGVQTRKNEGSTEIDYGAGPPSSQFKSVAEIRKAIDAENFPGEPDPSKDFTGFWKTDCDEPFGLQIVHFGTPGKYAVTFCGPGGCGTVGEDGRNTFITKDSHYEVVGESEIRIRHADGTWDTYHRCTKDTHPVLKYKKR